MLKMRIIPASQLDKKCFAFSSPNIPSTELSYGYVEDYIRRIENKRIRIGITGGEPFIHPDIMSFLHLPVSFPSLNFVISTNGSIKLDNAVLDSVIQGNWLVSISIHGEENTHNKYTESKSFKYVIENIKLLSSYTTVHIYTVLN